MEKTSMHTGFCHILRIDEDSKGLQMTLEGAPPCRLLNDHPQFQELRGLLCHQLHEEQTQGVRRPTWLALDENQNIAEVRMVGKGVPLSARRDESGAYWIVFPLTNLPRRLPPEHPRFREFERHLLLALEDASTLFFVTSAGNFSTIDDMFPSEPNGRPPQGNGAAVAGDKVVSGQRP
jgi:hypothetical protein